MADELTINASIAFDDGLTTMNAQVSDLLADADGTPSKCVQTIGTSYEALRLPTDGTARWCFFKNLDTTNYVEFKTSSSGVVFAKLLPGEGFPIPLGSGVTAPYAQANTAAINLEITSIPNAT